jgi:ubiquitin carboxyl-terminal hydrolase 14
LEEESVYREKELTELETLISPELKDDVGCSVTGLYDLVAIVTHKGAAADAGHYIGFVKKSVFHGAKAPSADGVAAPAPASAFDDNDEDWYKFDDDKVSDFPKEKLTTLDGGGEDSAAYVLLYKSKSLG